MMQSSFRSYLMALLSMLLIISTATGQESAADLERIQRATVYVMQVRGEDLVVTCAGTGTIVRYDGLILTNAHHTEQSATCPGDTLLIAMASRPGEPPVPRYRAEIAQVDSGRDLAVLRITREFDGRLIEPDNLPVFPFVEIGDASQMALDDTITLVGYPELGSAPSEAISGSISSFIAEPTGGTRSWLVVNAIRPIPGVFTGGGAYDRQGRLIGIPTTLPSGAIGIDTECQFLEDTNRDGFINNDDRCVPIGGFITVLRPINLARPLIRSASLKLEVELLTAPRFRATGSGTPQISRLFFSPSVTQGQPTTVVDRMPTGTDSLYLFFDYANMTPETVYELRVSIDGVPSDRFSLPPVRWSGGERGLWYIGSTGQVWQNGTYEFRIFVNGAAVAANSIQIGGPVQPQPVFRDIVFGTLNETGDVTGGSFVLPVSNAATGRATYRSMQPGTPWAAVWYYNGLLLESAVVRSTWNEADGTDGSYPISIQPAAGLQPGNYRLELYVGDFLSALGEFVVSGAREGPLPRVFSNLEFRRADSPLDTPRQTPARSYPDGVNTLYAYFDWNQIAPGTNWTLQWSVDDEVFYQQTGPWTISETGSDFTMRLIAPDGLPDGRYRMDLLVNNALLASEEVVIGIGQLPIDQLEEIGGTQLRGQIIDAETGDGLEGVTFLLITEDYSIVDFVYDTEQLYALAVTDRNGNFEIERSLELDSPYSVLIEADGYLPITVGGFTITEELLEEAGGSPIEMLIPLTRD